jgi:cytochrome c oxidase subunit II
VKKFWCLFFIFWPIVAVVACWIAPARGWWFPGATGEPGTGVAASPLGTRIDDLFYLILYIVTAAFIATQVALGYVLWRGAGHGEKKALFTHGSHNLEVIWTIVPAGILLFIALYQMDVWAQYRVTTAFPEEVRQRGPIAEITARQFEWRIRYPAPDRRFDSEAQVRRWLEQPEPDDLYTVNDLRVPTGRPVLVYLTTEDVQHAFFVPELRVKQDALPGQTIPVWFEVINRRPYDESLGGVSYEFLCAELCGWGHYKMKARLVAQPASDFEAWLRDLRQQQFDDGVSGGRRVMSDE